MFHFNFCLHSHFPSETLRKTPFFLPESFMVFFFFYFWIFRYLSSTELCYGALVSSSSVTLFLPLNNWVGKTQKSKAWRVIGLHLPNKLILYLGVLLVFLPAFLVLHTFHNFLSSLHFVCLRSRSLLLLFFGRMLCCVILVTPLRTGCVSEPKAATFVSFYTVSSDAEKNANILYQWIIYNLYIYGKIDIQNIWAVTCFTPVLIWSATKIF